MEQTGNELAELPSLDPSFVLSISKEGSLDCSEVAEYLQKMSVPCSVTSNISVQCDVVASEKNSCHIEKGCRIVFKENSQQEGFLTHSGFKI